MKRDYSATVPRRGLSNAAAVLAIGLAAALATPAFANGGPPGGGDRKGPPKEALAACKAKSVGDACSMKTPRSSQAVSGSCIKTPDKQVACLPKGAPKSKG